MSVTNTKGQVFCTTHNTGPFNKDSNVQQIHIEHNKNNNVKCIWEKYNPEKHNESFEDSDITNIDKIKQLNSLIQIEDPRYAGHNIKVSATLASNSISYNVPLEIDITCYNDHEKHSCNGLRELELVGNKLVQCVDVSDYVKETQLLKTAKKEGSYNSDCKLKVNEITSTTLKKIRIRPIVSSLEKNDGKFFDSDGNEWKSYDAYFRQDQIQTLEAGTEIDIVGRVISDPKKP